MKICKIEEGSPAARAKLCVGDEIVSIDGHEIHDVIDLKYYTYDAHLRVRVLRPDGREHTVRIRKEVPPVPASLFPFFRMTVPSAGWMQGGGPDPAMF